MLSPVSETLVVSAAGAATSRQRRRHNLPAEEAEDSVELSPEALAARESGDDEETSKSDD